MKFKAFTVEGADGRDITFTARRVPGRAGVKAGHEVRVTRPTQRAQLGLESEAELLGLFSDDLPNLHASVFESRAAKAVFGVVVKKQQQVTAATNSEVAELVRAIDSLF